jgi:hypothetical protein
MDITSMVVNLLILTLGSTVTPAIQAPNLTDPSHSLAVIYGVNTPHTIVSPKLNTSITQQHASRFESSIPLNQGSCFEYTGKYAEIYNLDVNLLNRIIEAESNGNPYAKNPRSTASGCAQFIQSTWAGTRRQMGKEWVTPFDAEANVETMAWKIAHGGLSAWNASRSKWAY